jgi:glycerol uptake facilitator-like aquaporin
LFVLSVGQISGAHINPAVTLGLYSLKKIDTASMISYIVAQFSGAMLAMVTMSMFLEGDLVTRVIVNADYQTFFAEFLGAFIFTFGIASAVYNKYKGVDAALVIGGSLTIGAFLASLGGNGLLNPAVATTVGSLNWSYVLGPILGGIIAMNVFALALTKKGKL